jgi:hypothetical protein
VLQKLCVFLLIIAIASVNATAKRYEGSGPWEDPTRWIPPGLPGEPDEIRIEGGNTLTVSSAVPTVLRVIAGLEGSGTLHILSGGVVTTTDWSAAAMGGGANTGTFNIDAGGAMNIGTHLWVAEAAASVGYMNVYGTVNVGGILGLGSVGFNPGGTGYLTVYPGGVLNLSNIHGDGSSSIMGSSVLNIIAGSSGLVTLPGDFVSVVQAYVDAGKITGNGDPANVVITCDMSTGFDTHVTAIPEPATIALLGIGGLLIRRRKA